MSINKEHLTKRRGLHFLRRPHTKQENTINGETFEDEDLPAYLVEKIKPRGKRRNLPDAWDDKPVSLWKSREFTDRWMKNRPPIK